MDIILNEILKSADPSYKAFHKKLIPTIDEGTILGVRAPQAMAIAKKFASTNEGNEFLSSLPHTYYDENIVHAFMLGCLKCDNEKLHRYIECFLPYIDNWAVCDGLCAHIKCFFTDIDQQYDFVLSCLESEHTYTVRFSLVCLLSYYVNDKYIDRLLSIVKEVKSEEYYINMALAWLISVMLVKQYEKTLPLLEGGTLPLWVHNKSIQKAKESLRISTEQKTYLKGLRR